MGRIHTPLPSDKSRIINVFICFVLLPVEIYIDILRWPGELSVLTHLSRRYLSDLCLPKGPTPLLLYRFRPHFLTSNRAARAAARLSLPRSFGREPGARQLWPRCWHLWRVWVCGTWLCLSRTPCLVYSQIGRISVCAGIFQLLSLI